MGMHRVRHLVVASAAAAIGLGSVATVSASAASSAAAATNAATSQSTNAASFVPLRGATSAIGNDRVFKNMDYNGGPIMPTNTDYMVLWSPSGLGAYPAGYVNGLAQYFTDLAHDSGGHQNTDSVSTQYADLTGASVHYAVTFGGAIVDTDPYPTSHCPVHGPVKACLTDKQLQRELEAFAAAHHFQRDLHHEFFLLTPPHVEGCFNDTPPTFGFCSAGIVPQTIAAYCAYHSNTSISPFLLYADDPYVVGNPGCDDGNHPNGIWDGELSGGLSHEHNESITDPIPNDAWTNGVGKQHGEEIGDQCDGQMGTPLGRHNGAKYNQVINGHFYWYQEEWSNKTHSCLQRLAPSGSAPTAELHVTAGSGLTLKFDATGSTAPGGVADYSWQFNDSHGDVTIERTGPTISHTFPSAGAYSVGLTVFAGNGASAGTGGIVQTGSSGLVRGFTFSPAHPAVSQTVTFHALKTVSARPVLVYFWDFGDGSTGAGANPEHAYSRPGTYTVTSVLFSGIGSAYPGSGAAPITTQTVTVT